MLKIKNRNHFDTAEEIVAVLLDKIQKIAAEAGDIYNGPGTMAEKVTQLDYKQTELATLSNFLNNELGYEVRTPDGILFTAACFNRVFYFHQMAAVELTKRGQEEATE